MARVAHSWSNRLAVRDRRPLYLQAVEGIQALIAERGLRPGDRLPSEVELASLFGVGRSTIREAMGYLELARVVDRRRGVGTVLARPEPERAAEVGLETLESLEALAARQGWRCETRDLRIRPSQATEEQARRLGVEAGSPVAVITRTKVREGRPISEMVSFVPERVMSLEALEREFETSITELMVRRHSPPLSFARAEVTAVPCDRRLARRLRMRAGDPVLLIEELFVGQDGTVLAFNLLYFVPQSIRLEVIRRPPRDHLVPAVPDEHGAATPG
jgi:GntR family transcriptional regulator